MAVTDMTESLPWWARGAGPTGQGPAPPRGGNSAAWLQYLASMFSPSSANAAEAPVSAANGGPSPDDIAALKAAQAAGPQTQPPDVPAAAPHAAAHTHPPPPDPAPPPKPIPPDPRPAATHMPFPGQIDPRGYFAPSVANPNAPAPAAQPVSASRAAGPVAGPLASSRFIGIDRPNADPLAGGRGGGGGPQGTALDLSGLFHGKPTVSVTRGLGAMANGGAPQGDNWDIDANGNVTPRYGPAGGGRQSGGFVAPSRQRSIFRS